MGMDDGREEFQSVESWKYCKSVRPSHRQFFNIIFQNYSHIKIEHVCVELYFSCRVGRSQRCQTVQHPACNTAAPFEYISSFIFVSLKYKCGWVRVFILSKMLWVLCVVPWIYIENSTMSTLLNAKQSFLYYYQPSKPPLQFATLFSANESTISYNVLAVLKRATLLTWSTKPPYDSKATILYYRFWVYRNSNMK